MTCCMARTSYNQLTSTQCALKNGDEVAISTGLLTILLTRATFGHAVLNSSSNKRKHPPPWWYLGDGIHEKIFKVFRVDNVLTGTRVDYRVLLCLT